MCMAHVLGRALLNKCVRIGASLLTVYMMSSPCSPVSLMVVAWGVGEERESEKENKLS